MATSTFELSGGGPTIVCGDDACSQLYPALLCQHVLRLAFFRLRSAATLRAPFGSEPKPLEAR